MRRFEFKQGTSSKFWQVELQGAGFTVTFGRIGTTGQTLLKTLADDAAAETALDKLIGEKTRKGYVEVTAGSTKSPAAPKAVERAKAPPAKASVAAEAPSGKPTAPATKAPGPASPATSSAVAWTRRARDRVVAGRRKGVVLAAEPFDVAAALARMGDDPYGHLDSFRKGLSKARPELAKLTKAVLASLSKGRRKPLSPELEGAALHLLPSSELQPDLVGLWLAEEGLPFAIRALDRSLSLSVDVAPGQNKLWLASSPSEDAGEAVVHALRRGAASASEEDYRAAVAVAAELRTGAGPKVRAQLDYVFPTEQAWAEADAREAIAQKADLDLFLLAALRTPALAAKLLDAAQAKLAASSSTFGDGIDVPEELVFTLVDEHQAAAAPLLRRILEGRPKLAYEEADRTRCLGEALALIETPESAEVLASNLADPRIKKAALPFFTRAPHAAIPGLATAIAARAPGGRQARRLPGDAGARPPRDRLRGPAKSRRGRPGAAGPVRLEEEALRGRGGRGDDRCAPTGARQPALAFARDAGAVAEAGQAPQARAPHHHPLGARRTGAARPAGLEPVRDVLPGPERDGNGALHPRRRLQPRPQEPGRPGREEARRGAPRRPSVRRRELLGHPAAGGRCPAGAPGRRRARGLGAAARRLPGPLARGLDDAGAAHGRGPGLPAGARCRRAVDPALSGACRRRLPRHRAGRCEQGAAGRGAGPAAPQVPRSGRCARPGGTGAGPPGGGRRAAAARPRPAAGPAGQARPAAPLLRRQGGEPPLPRERRRAALGRGGAPGDHAGLLRARALRRPGPGARDARRRLAGALRLGSLPRAGWVPVRPPRSSGRSGRWATSAATSRRAS
ncbi:MAG: WGR domain-containing protein [Myxococcales bacterium]